MKSCSVGKNPPANAGDMGSILGSGRSPEEGNGNPLQHSCLGNPMGRGAWQATVHEVARESDMTYRLNNNNTMKSFNKSTIRGNRPHKIDLTSNTNCKFRHWRWECVVGGGFKIRFGNSPGLTEFTESYYTLDLLQAKGHRWKLATGRDVQSRVWERFKCGGFDYPLSMKSWKHHLLPVTLCGNTEYYQPGKLS